MHIHTCIHELSMRYACIKYTYIAYIHICVLVEFCVSFVVTFQRSPVFVSFSLRVDGICSKGS